MPAAHIALALTVALIWGINFVVIKVGVESMPPLVLCALRFLFAAVPAVFVVKRPAVDWRLVAGFGFVLGVVKFGLLFTAIKLGMPAGLASLVLQLQAFFTVALALVFRGERPGRHQILGGGVALAGIGLIASARTGTDAVLPIMLTLAAALAWGVANILTKRAGRVDMLAFTVWASLVPPVPLLALALVLDGPQAVGQALAGIDLAGLGAIAYLAYPTTVVGFAIWSFLLARHPAAAVTPFALLVPVFGLASAALVLGERLSPVELAGAAIVLAGLVVNVFGKALAGLIRSRPARAAPPRA